MSERRRNLAPNMLWVCVDFCDQTTFSGRIYSIMQESPLIYNDFIQFVLHSDDFFDSIGFPQAFQKKRSFIDDKEELPEFSILRKKERIDSELVMQHKGEIATYIVVVETRQHTEWQGKILTTDFATIQEFQDVLDLSKVLLEEVAITR